MTPEIYGRIMNEYNNRQNRALRLADRRREEIFAKIPRIRQICEELGGVSALMARVFETDDLSHRAQRLNDIKSRTEALIKEKKKLLTDFGYPADYMENVYVCPICRDTGFVDDEQCSCFKACVREKMYEDSSMKSENDGECFEALKLDFYSDEINPRIGTSVRKYMEEVVKICRSFANAPKGNMLFTGGTGLGKSFLCHSIAKELLSVNTDVVCDTAFSLFDKLIKNRFDINSEREYKDSIFNCTVLIIDDLGTETINQITAAELFNIINYRLINKKPTVISTNLSIEKIKEVYSERIFSRIVGEYRVIPFFGSDIRILKKRKG